MELTRLQERVNEVQWFQKYEILPGLMTNGVGDMARRLPYFGIPDDLRGKRVLDIGCNDGYFAFLAEERGAEVVAIDSWPRRGFLLAHELRSAKTEFHHLNVCDITPERLGFFDIVFFFGVYYHLKHPLLALERIASVTREVALIESEIEPATRFGTVSASLFYVQDALNNDPSNWWVPTVPCLIETTLAAGFPRAELLHVYDGNRAVIRAEKGPRTAAKLLTDDFYIAIDTPQPHQRLSGPTPISGWAISQMQPQSGIERILVYLDRLDDASSLLGEALYGRQRPDLAQHYGEAYAASGFDFLWDAQLVSPGEHVLHIFVEGEAGWCVRSIPVTVGTESAGTESVGSVKQARGRDFASRFSSAVRRYLPRGRT